MIYATRILITLGFCALLASSVWACKVPVFRYALERWDADKYEVLVVHDGPLDDSTGKLLDKLTASPSAKTSNIHARAISIDNLRDPKLSNFWKDRENKESPLMIVLYPRTAAEVPDRVLLVQSFTGENVDNLLQSKVRDQIAARLSSGQSAVWVFVPSGNERKDTVALQVLKDRMEFNAKHLSAPSAEELEIAPEILAKNKIPLRIEFSVISLHREDPNEALLLSSLLKSEADLDSQQPMAFPVFGRGRVLYALVGDGIMPATIDNACQFISGPCSCQVKNQNPGFDLLINRNWESDVAGAVISTAIPEENLEPQLLAIPPGRRAK